MGSRGTASAGTLAETAFAGRLTDMIFDGDTGSMILLQCVSGFGGAIGAWQHEPGREGGGVCRIGYRCARMVSPGSDFGMMMCIASMPWKFA